MRLGSAIGYVHTIAEEECDWKQALLIFARGFGACVRQCDDPASDRPKLASVGNYAYERLNEASLKLDEWLLLSDEQRIEQVKAEIASELDNCENLVKESIQANAFIDDLIDSISAWQPPTEEHTELKQSAVRWLHESKQTDDYTLKRIGTLKKADPIAIASTRNAELCAELNKAREYLKEEQERVDSRNEWITALYESLGLSVDIKECQI